MLVWMSEDRHVPVTCEILDHADVIEMAMGQHDSRRTGLRSVVGVQAKPRTPTSIRPKYLRPRGFASLFEETLNRPACQTRKNSVFIV